MTGIDIVADVRALPFKDSIANFIYASDILEHVPRCECYSTLTEWYRVLEDGGGIHIKVPNLYTIALKIVHRVIDGYEAARLLFANQDHKENFHRNGFTQDTLNTELQRAGFKTVFILRTVEGPDSNNMELMARK